MLGCGLMGSGIAEVVARAGYDVRVLELAEQALEEGRSRIDKSLQKAVEREKISAEERESSLARVSFGTDLGALADRDLIIEAVVEELEVKNELFQRLDSICPEPTIFASNTSSLTISDMAAVVGRPDRLVGLHFFNPVPVMKLVEVVRTIATSAKTLARVTAFAQSLGKEAVTVMDSSGFIVNRLLIPFMLDAVRLVEARVASIENLDKSMVLGCGHPMGPLALCDFVGIDTVHRIAEIMYSEYRTERFAPPPLLRRLVVMGRFGRKSGVGFYDYSGDEPVPLKI